MKNYSYILSKLDCASCAKKLEEAIEKEDIFSNVNINFSTSKLKFTSKDNIEIDIIENKLKEIILKVEPDVKFEREQSDSKSLTNNKEVNAIRFDIMRIALGIIVFLIAQFLNKNSYVFLLLIMISICIMLVKTMLKAISKLIKNKVIDEDFLITVSVIGAYLIGNPTEGLMVILLYEIGKILENKAINKSRKSVAALMDIRPEVANVKIGTDVISKLPEEVNVGDIILIKSGEKIPLDCTIISGNANIDNSVLTGESKILNLSVGDKLLSGAINIDGVVEARVDNNYKNSTVSRILKLVENATDKKAKTENFVSRIAKIYTPIVIVLAILVAIFMPILFKDVTYSQSIYKALVFLVISCPCSIAISVPLAYFSGIGKASKTGILVKGSNYLDGLKDIKEIIFDKTGTITTGKFSIESINVVDNNFTIDEIKRYFLLGESYSTHPIANSVLESLKYIQVDTEKVINFKEIKGQGISFDYEEKHILIGNVKFTNANNVDSVNTVLYLNVDGAVIGNIVLTDTLKEDAIKTMGDLKKLGIITKMYTGDNKLVAENIAQKVGVNEVKSELLPTDKYELVEKELENNTTDKKIAFVGDGINDSPALARADIGISMGGIGASSSIEASDIVIMTDELKKIHDAIKISKFTNKIIVQNLIFSIGVKVLILIFTTIGFADMWQAVFADVGVTLITIINTLRILK